MAAIILVLACALLAMPAVSAGRSAKAPSSKPLPLTGVVEGPTHPGSGESCPYPAELVLLEGQRTVGTMHFRRCFLFAATDIRYHGWVKLEIGRLGGKLRVSINFRANAQGQLPYGEGSATKVVGKRRLAEGIRVKRAAGTLPIPTADNEELEVLLNPSGPFPPQQ